MHPKNSTRQIPGGADQQDRRGSQWIGLSIAGVLFLAAALILWRTISGWRREEALNRGDLYTRPAITSRIGPAPAGPMVMFDKLDLTPDQRQQIRQILNSSMSTTPPGKSSLGPGISNGRGNGLFLSGGPLSGGPPGAASAGAPLAGAPLAGAPLAGAPLAGAPLAGAPSAGGGGKRGVFFRIPMDKIRAVLTPERRQKLNAEGPGAHRMYLPRVYRRP